MEDGGSIQDGGLMDSGFSCDMCGSSYQAQLEMLKCHNSHKTPTNLKCEQCELYFGTAAQMGTHVVLFHSIDDEGEEIEGDEDIEGVGDYDDSD